MKIHIDNLDDLDVNHSIDIPTDDLHGLVDHVTNSAITIIVVGLVAHVIKSAVDRSKA